MDFGAMLKTHAETKADVTIAVLPVAQEQTSGFGIMRLDDDGRVVGFVEKPKTAEALAPMYTAPEWIEGRGIPCNNRPYLASMGIYLFTRQALFSLLNAPPLATDFGKEVFPRSIKTHRVQAHLFDGYWEDVGTVKAYHEASLALTQDPPPFDFHSPDGVIYTRMRYLPASRISASSVEQCLVSDGCVVHSGTSVTRCILGVRTRIGHNSAVRNTVIMGADRFETDAERTDNRRRGVPDMIVGNGCLIENAILDKDCRIGNNVRIVNGKGLENDDGKNYVIRDGIVVIPKGAVVLDDTMI
jgi:glucose-1-phosphate adenylyltransferase